MTRTYTVTVTYEATFTTDMNYTEEDIENALWVGDLEIGAIGYNTPVSVRGDAIDYEVQIQEE